jgi:hypothetical protein
MALIIRFVQQKFCYHQWITCGSAEIRCTTCVCFAGSGLLTAKRNTNGFHLGALQV